MQDFQKELVLSDLQEGNTAMVNFWTALINGLSGGFLAGSAADIATLKALWLHAISVYS